MKNQSRKILIQLMLLAVILLINISGWSQIQVTGTVTGENETLVGATVVVKGTSEGVITDLNGEYSIEVPDESSVLIFSYVGFIKQEIKVGNQQVINVQLKTDTRQIDELVVIGYGVQKKSDLTGAVTSIKGEELVKTPVLNIDQAMQGRAAGVQIASNSGAPGSSLTVRIRGVGTIGNADPLYVVDGLPVGDANFLNPADIEDVQILKDASACAIYGAAAANGVVLITTKRGTKKEMQVNYSTYYGIQNFASTYEVMNSQQFAAKNIEAYINDKNKLAGTYVYDKIAETQSDGSIYLNYDKLITTDWQSQIIKQNAPIKNHYLSFSGGSDNINFLISMGYHNQEGIIITTGAEKYSFKISIDAHVSKKLKVGTNVNYNISKINRQPENIIGNSPLGNALQMDPTVPVYSTDSLLAAGYDKYQSGFVNILNPLAAIEYRNRPGERNSNSLVGNIFGEYSITDDLKFRTSIGLHNAVWTTTAFYPKFIMQHPTDQWLEAEYFERWERNNDISFENQLTFHKNFNKRHDLTALVGFSAYTYTYRIIDADKVGAINNTPEMQYLSGSLNPTATVYGTEVKEAMESVLGRAIYSFEDKYLITASLRYDGSSKFGPNNRWGSFPSFSLGWKLSNEEFMKSFKNLSLLKLRAGWGIIGNNQIGSKKYSAKVDGGEGQYSYTFVKDGVETFYGGMAPPSLANKDIRWEESVQKNIGIDLNLWKNQFQLTTDFFIKNTKGMLLTSPVPGYVGLFEDPVSNQGDIQNMGFELSLSYTKRIGDFSYQIAGNLSHVKNEIISMGDSDAQNFGTNRNQVGFPVMSFYGYKADGIFQNYDEIRAHAMQNARTTPGDLKFRDINNDGKINSNDNTIIGKPWPDFTYGFNLSATYKGIDISMFIQGVSGIDIYNAMRAALTDPSRNMTIEMLDSWSPDNTDASLPKATIEDINLNRSTNSFWVEDGSFLRIKNAQLGYSLPEKLNQKLNINNCRIYVSAQNLFTFTKYSGYDPEISYSNRWYGGTQLGYDGGNYPAARTFLLGLDINF
ncbi:MAG: TonB-dependent receptor [Prolixibacteraceae bacterium]|nr:TonB-dependent receptor [Prolixibacteraceae bacterium]